MPIQPLLILVLIASNKDADYAKDIRPLLHSRCVSCHGPLRQEGGLRVDTGLLLRQGGDSGSPVQPGKSDESLLIEALTGDVKTWRMPPEGEPVSPAELAKIKSWIDGGAESPADEKPAASPATHWSFQPVKKPPVPEIQWGSNEVDRFLAESRQRHSLGPVALADRRTLLRRLHLDLVGLPPTPAQIVEFLADNSTNAYEKVVDQLLASPRYGERWGRHWMDVWRYSDWYGYQAEVRNSQPNIWHWRDWIIENINEDTGYDKMIVAMLAGDELSPGDPKTARATGFLARNWYKFNRNVWLDNTVEHTAKAFLGITMNCAKCHSHKYDPIAHTDYYRFRAFFEPHEVRTDSLAGMDIPRVFDKDLDKPTYVFVRGDEKKPVEDDPQPAAFPEFLSDETAAIQVVSLPAEVWYPALNAEVQQKLLAEAKANLIKLEQAQVTASNAVAAAEKTLAQLQAPEKDDAETKVASAGTWLLDHPFTSKSDGVWDFGPGDWNYEDGCLKQQRIADELSLVQSKNNHPRDFSAEFVFQTTGGARWKSVGLSFDLTDMDNHTGIYLSAVEGGTKVQVTPKSAGNSQYPPEGACSYPVQINREYILRIDVRDQLVNARVNGELVLAYLLPTPRREGKLALWTYDATAEFRKVRVGQLEESAHLVAKLDKKPQAPMTIEQAEDNLQLAKAKLALSTEQTQAAAAKAESVQATIVADKAKFGLEQAENKTPLAEQAAKAEKLAALADAKSALAKAEVDLLANKDKSKSEALIKAVADARSKVEQAEKASTETTSEYSPLGPTFPQTSTGRRLALAKWIADKNNPLTARVAVNQVWMRHFGQPLVESVFDFGMNGREPSHPELLDWLASEFVAHNWSMKWLHKVLVTSTTYQLSSAVGDNQSALEADPRNIYLWRMNTRRMEAEIVRDAVLHLAGKLDTTMGGPELDEVTALTSHRRSVYYRHAPEKMVEFLDLFNSASVTECYRRAESIVPQQALAMANNSQGVDQARLLCRKLNEGAKQPSADFVRTAFEHILGRLPSDAELQSCSEFLESQGKLLENPQGLTKFPGKVRTATPPATDPGARARENLVHVLLNHNDFITVR